MTYFHLFRPIRRADLTYFHLFRPISFHNKAPWTGHHCCPFLPGGCCPYTPGSQFFPNHPRRNQVKDALQEPFSKNNLQFVEAVLKSGKKKEHKINFLGPESDGSGGGLPREGVVVEKFVPSLESLFSLGLEGRKLGCPGNFVGMSRTPRGVQKVCAKKVRAHFSFPMKTLQRTFLRLRGSYCRKTPSFGVFSLSPFSLTRLSLHSPRPSPFPPSGRA